MAAAMLMMAGIAMAQGAMPIPVDEAVRMGKLENGLTYYVRHNDYPEHRVNFYIAQRVGSIQEEESQRGLAHFLEHMAFNGTENFPGNGVIDYTRNLGVEFGRDLNAYTSTDQTVYNINDVPSTRQSALDSCLLILRDWSCGLLLEDEEIDKECGVIHEEWRLRRSAQQRMLENCLETLFPGSKYGKRMPIGLMSVVDGFKYNELRDYYHKWYRPDNQAIVVVGDIDVDYMENLIKTYFSPIVLQPNAAQVVDEPVPDNEEAIIVVEKDKEQQYSIIQLMFKHDPSTREEKKDVMYMVEDYAMDLISEMYDQRLTEKAQEADCPFLQAGTYNGNYLGMSANKEAFVFYCLPKPDMANEALQAVMVEALRASMHGFTAGEYERAKAEYLSRLEKTYNERNKITNEVYGRSLIANYLEGEPIPSIEQEYQIVNMLAPNIPVDLINQVLPELIPQNEHNMVVVNFNQEAEGKVYPTVEGFRSAINAARASDIEAYVDNTKNEPLMTVMPTPGTIVSEKKGDKFDYTELTLSNGVKVILKKTDLKENEIRMEAESKGGSSLYGKEDYANLEMFDAVVGMSGLGAFDNTELTKALAGKQANVDLGMSTSYETLSGKSTVKDLETLFQLTYLTMTDIHKDEKAFNNLMNQLSTMLKNKHLDPNSAFSDSVSVTLSNHNWREKPFDESDIANVNLDRIMAIAKERTANAADFTFYFVGNFDEQLIREYLCQYIASLPANASRENYNNVQEYALGKVLNHFTRKMETPKAMSYMFWYNLTEPYSMRGQILASMAGQLLDKVYLQKIREDAGAAYSASAFGMQRRTGDLNQTMVIGVVPMTPEKSDLALNIMREEAANLAKTVDAASLADIKEVMIKDYNTSIKENSYWMNVLTEWVGRGNDDHTGYEEMVNSIKPEDVSAFMRNVVLAAGNNVEVVMLPEQ